MTGDWIMEEGEDNKFIMFYSRYCASWYVTLKCHFNASLYGISRKPRIYDKE